MSEETRKAEKIEQGADGSELSEKDLDKAAGGIAVSDSGAPSTKTTPSNPLPYPFPGTPTPRTQP
jgi:hypothetical protein